MNIATQESIIEKISNGKTDEAIDELNLIDNKSDIASWAMRARIVIAESMLQDSNLDAGFIDNVSEVIFYLADIPGDIRVRNVFEGKLINGCNGMVMHAMLSLFVKSHADRINQNHINEDIKGENAFNGKSLKEYSKIWKRLFKKYLKENVPVFLGKQSIDPQDEKDLDRGFLEFLKKMLTQTVRNRTVEEDVKFIRHIIHFTIITCRVIKESHEDINCVNLAVGALMQSGHSQPARDIAETLISATINSQEEDLECRKFISWLTYGDILLRAHNPTTALFYASVACASIRTETIPAHEMADADRFFSKLFRDLGMLDIALEFVELEKGILLRTPSLSHKIFYLKHVEISIKLRALCKSQHPTEGQMVAVAEDCCALLNEINSTIEVAPLVSALASVIHLSNEFEYDINPIYRDKVEKLLPRVPIQTRNQIKAQLNKSNHSMKSFRDLILGVGAVRFMDDLDYQINPLAIAAEKAIPQSIRNNDVDLYLISSAILSQPGLTMRQIKLNVLRQKINASTESIDSSRLDESTKKAFEQYNEAMQMDLHDFSPLLDVIKIKWSELLTSEEEVVVILCRTRGGITFLRISSDTMELQKLKENQWDDEVYESMDEHKELLNKLKTFGSHVGRPASNDLYDLFSKLNLCSIVSGNKKYTIICPSSSLFNFPFSLSLKVNGLSSPVSTSPSALWLYEIRKHGLRKSKKVAWLGGGNTEDETIINLKRDLQLTLAEHKFIIDENTTPCLTDDCGISIIASHGALNCADGFSHITNEKTNLTPASIGLATANTKCVILFICHSGQIDDNRFNNEKHGLISNLLRNNVSCVIAASWPIRIDLAAKWFNYFMNTNAIDPVSIRVDAALDTLSKEYGDNAYIKAYLTTYGDGGTILN